MANVFLNGQSLGRISGGTHNKSSKLGPNIQPSLVFELSEKLE